MSDIFFIRPRLVTKSWLFRYKSPSPSVVFDIYERYRYWDDPTYGNGGGEWCDLTRKIASYKNEEEAIKICNLMNSYTDKRET